MDSKRDSSEGVARLVVKLRKWIGKRKAKGLDCAELVEACDYLTNYQNILSFEEMQAHSSLRRYHG